MNIYDIDQSSPEDGAEGTIRRPVPDRKERLFAIGRFLLFVVLMGAFLTGLRVVLSKLPTVGPLLKSADTGTLTPGLMWVIDSIGFLAVLAFSAIAARREKLPIGAYGLSLRGTFGRLFVRGLVCGGALASLDIGVTWMLGGFTFGGFALRPSVAIQYGLAWGVAFVLVGLFEEYLFRGYALYTLSLGVGYWPAAITLAAIFGGLHLNNSGESVIGALDVFVYALFASLTLRRTGSLWFAVGVHAAWDFSLTFLYSVPGSGLNAQGVLLHSALHGRIWLTGGPAGPEGSAVGLAVIVVAYFVFHVRTRSVVSLDAGRRDH